MRQRKTAAKDIINGKKIKLDIGRFNNRYFSYTASFGAFTSASYSTPQEIKNLLGQTAYIFEGIKGIGTIKPIHMKFTTEDKVVEGDFLFGAISNSMSVGGIVKFDERTVKLNDGLFEVLLIRNPNNILKLNVQHLAMNPFLLPFENIQKLSFYPHLRQGHSEK